MFTEVDVGGTNTEAVFMGRREGNTTGSLLGTSRDRGWNGLHAELWSCPEGGIENTRPNETQIIVILKGHSKVQGRREGRLYDSHVVPGTVWLSPAGVAADTVYLRGRIPELICIYLPNTRLAEAALRECGVYPSTVDLLQFGAFRDPLIEHIAMAVRCEVVDPNPVGDRLVEYLASALAIHVLRRFSDPEPASVTPPNARGVLDSRRLRRVTDLIEAHLSEDLSIERLAGEACLSPFHFCRSFKAATGKTPHQYTTERRFEKAKFLLAEGRYPLTEVADLCGITSQSYFHTWFRRLSGTTPSTYQRSCQ